MLKKIYKILKKLSLSFLILYGYNILVPYKAIIPINMITVLIITVFSYPALFIFIIIKLLIY